MTIKQIGSIEINNKRRFRNTLNKINEECLIKKKVINRRDISVKYIIYLVDDKRDNLAAPSEATYVYPSSTVVKFHIGTIYIKRKKRINF